MAIIILVIFLLIIIGYKLLKINYIIQEVWKNHYKKPNDKIKDYIYFLLE